MSRSHHRTSVCFFSKSFACPLAVALLAVTTLTTSTRAENAYEAWPVDPTTGLRAKVYDATVQAGQVGNAIAFDARGNVYVTGYAQDPDSLEPLMYTAKYDGLNGASNGGIGWQRLFSNGQSGGDSANALAVDSQGNVIITGGSYNAAGNSDMLTIKYSADGSQILWSKRYNGPAGGADEGVKVVVDSSDNVVVTGKSVGVGTQYDWVTIKYDSNGNEVWAAPVRMSGGGHVDDVPTGLAIGAFNTVIVTGEVVRTLSGNQSWATVEYLGTTGAVVWGPVYYQDASGEDSGATAVVYDGSGNTVVTGYSTRSTGSRDFHTIKYDINGAPVWGQNVDTSGNFSPYGPVSVAVDSLGNPVVTGTNTISSTQYYYTVKYHAAAPGSEIWHQTTQNVSTGNGDFASQVVVDSADNAIVTGGSNSGVFDLDYYTVAYAPADGATLWSRRFDGGVQGDDTANAVAVDPSGNIAITGVAHLDYFNNGQDTGISYDRFVTVKYNRLAIETGDPVPGAGVDPVPDNAVFSALNTPAIGDPAALALRVTAKGGRTKVTGIYATPPGGAQITAVQGGTPPTVSSGVYKSFSDPIVTPDGKYAFAAKLSGPKGTPATALFSNIPNDGGPLAAVLQEGQQVPGLPAGVLLQSISSYAGRGADLLALVKVTGKTAGVDKANSTALMNLSGANGYPILRTGEMLTVNGNTAPIKTLSVLLPSRGSPGNGRTQGDTKIVGKVTLADKEKTTVIVSTGNAGGIPVNLLYSGQDASQVRAGATWKTFGEPATDGTGTKIVVLGTLTPKVGGIKSTDNTALMYSSNNSTFTYIAREGDACPISPDTYASFSDPLVNNDNGNATIAFTATIKGKDVSGANKTILVWGSYLPGFQRVLARLGDKAPDIDGNLTSAEYSSFVSVALPNGHLSRPVFLAKLKGKGVTAKNNLGLFAFDSSTNGLMRRLLTSGDILPTGDDPVTSGDPVPTEKISKMALLSAIPPVAGQTRSVNDNEAVAALLTFSDKNQAIVVVGTP